MIRTTDFFGNQLLIDPFSIDLVIYQETEKNEKFVRLFIQNVPVDMCPKVFEADVLPTIEEESKHGTLND